MFQKIMSPIPHLRNPDSRIWKIFDSGIWNPGYFCLWNLESWALEYGIQLKESRIQVQLTKTGIKCLDSGIHGIESRNQDCLGIPYKGQEVSVF